VQNVELNVGFAIAPAATSSGGMTQSFNRAPGGPYTTTNATRSPYMFKLSHNSIVGEDVTIQRDGSSVAGQPLRCKLRSGRRRAVSAQSVT
jgi:hypothetical protein